MSTTQETKKIMTYEKIELYDALIKAFINGKIFIGTTEQYKTANAAKEIVEGCLVCITDDNEDKANSGGSSSDGSTNTDTSSTTAVLGYAILGQMILG